MPTIQIIVDNDGTAVHAAKMVALGIQQALTDGEEPIACLQSQHDKVLAQLGRLAARIFADRRQRKARRVWKAPTKNKRKAPASQLRGASAPLSFEAISDRVMNVIARPDLDPANGG